MKKKIENQNIEMKKTHYTIPIWKINSLKKIGESYKVPFNDAPFNNSKEEGYYDIDLFRKTKKWESFLKEIKSLGVHFEYAFDGTGTEKNKIFMTITLWEKREN
jgi:hypothetical protein